MKPICVPCHRFFRIAKSGVYFTEGMPRGGVRAPPGLEAPDRWKPYKVWCGDLWKCQGCGAQIISGTGLKPVTEHYKPDFDQLKERVGAHYQVNDC